MIGLPGRRGHRDRACQILRGDEVGDERRCGRVHEGAGDAEHGEDGEDPGGRDRSGDGEGEKGQPAGRLDELAHGNDAATVVAVRHRAGDQNQEQGGGELNEADEAEVEGIAGQIVDCQPTATLRIWAAKVANSRDSQNSRKPRWRRPPMADWRFGVCRWHGFPRNRLRKEGAWFTRSAPIKEAGGSPCLSARCGR